METKFDLPVTTKFAYAHSPEQMAIQVAAMEKIAEVNGYEAIDWFTTSDGIWWLTRIVFAKKYQPREVLAG